MTIRHTPAQAEIEACLDFTPVPRKARIDGWSPERQRNFIAALGRFGTVTAAAKQVAMSVEGAYYLRRQPGSESFARAWGRAINIGIHALRDLAYERAVVGTPKGVWHNGERVGEELVKNDRLLMFMLRHEQPATHGAPKRLPPGTKHPATIAREARWAGAEDAELAEPDEEQDAARSCAMLGMYTARAGEERRARLAGDMAAADFMLRQLTLLELVISLDADPETVSRVWPAALGIGSTYGGSPKPDTALADALAEARRQAWAAAGDPPRPDLAIWFPKLKRHDFGGATWREREHARTEAQRQMAHAVALYEATHTDADWARWTAAVDADGGGGGAR